MQCQYAPNFQQKPDDLSLSLPEAAGPLPAGQHPPCNLGILWDHLGVLRSREKLHLAGCPCRLQFSRWVWEQRGQGQTHLGIHGEGRYIPVQLSLGSRRPER